MNRLGVLGWPVSHSRSPAMHRAALAETGLTGWSYQLLPVPPELFDETVRGLPEAGFVGANVTIPHKEAALRLSDDLSDAAREIGAVNTLSFADGRIHGDNTDAPGLLRALGRTDLTGETAVLLGAGGSARACAYALRNAGAEVHVWNRTPDRAKTLAEQLGVQTLDVPLQNADLLVNCTSVGLHDPAATFKVLPLTADALGGYATVIDLVYRQDETELLQRARAAGCLTVDGLEFLVGQGALSFEAWTGQQAPVTAMRKGARGADTPGNDESRHPAPQAGHGRSDDRGDR